MPHSIKVVHLRWPVLVFNKNKKLSNLINKLEKIAKC